MPTMVIGRLERAGASIALNTSKPFDSRICQALVKPSAPNTSATHAANAARCFVGNSVLRSTSMRAFAPRPARPSEPVAEDYTE